MKFSFSEATVLPPYLSGPFLSPLRLRIDTGDEFGKHCRKTEKFLFC